MSGSKVAEYFGIIACEVIKGTRTLPLPRYRSDSGSVRVQCRSAWLVWKSPVEHERRGLEQNIGP